ARRKRLVVEAPAGQEPPDGQERALVGSLPHRKRHAPGLAFSLHRATHAQETQHAVPEPEDDRKSGGWPEDILDVPVLVMDRADLRNGPAYVGRGELIEARRVLGISATLRLAGLVDLERGVADGDRSPAQVVVELAEASIPDG